MTPARLLATIAACTTAASATAEVRLSPAFSDHAVLQRDRPVRIFGLATKGERITVTLRDAQGRMVRSGSAVGSLNGEFVATLDPLDGSTEPLTLEVEGENTVTARDLVVGDVWVAGGQSNMEWPLAATGAQLADALAVADDAGIRMMTVPHVTANRPARMVDAKWTVGSRDTVPQMSAVAFWFARAVRARTGMPVGILSINWGGSRAEPWADLSALNTDPTYTSRVSALRAEVAGWNAQGDDARNQAFDLKRREYQAAGTAWWNAVNAEEPGIAGRWAVAETPTDGEGWEKSALPARWADDPELKNFDGVVWYRRSIEVPQAWAGKECFIELGPIDDADVLFFDGVPVANTIGDWRTPRRYRIPAARVRAGSIAIALEVLDMQGAGGVMGDAAAMRMTCPSAGGDAVPLAGEWMRRRGRGSAGLPPFPTRPERDTAPGTRFADPAAMFNGMIAPFSGLAVRGAIWYQGESNAGSEQETTEYRSLLQLVIRSWRAAFQYPDMPFGVVSLAAFRPFQPDRAVSGTWPGLRDAQLNTERNSPSVGTVTTIDVGDADDIHPRDKRTVGERLSRWAASTVYGAADVAWRGPRTKNARREGDGLRIEFDVEGGRLHTRDGKPLAGFAIAGADGRFVVAEAEIIGATAVNVRSSEVAEPFEVRYAWQDNPANANLADEASKLPAHPFSLRVEADPVRLPQRPSTAAPQ
jgi:sialate O-acetylesterase